MSINSSMSGMSGMSNDFKRKRNFTEEEKNFLVELVHQNQEVITSKDNKSSMKVLKDKVWNEIFQKFNERCVEVEAKEGITQPTRTLDQLKKCWENLRTKAKREYKQLNVVQTPEENRLQNKIINIIGDELDPPTSLSTSAAIISPTASATNSNSTPSVLVTSATGEPGSVLNHALTATPTTTPTLTASGISCAPAMAVNGTPLSAKAVPMAAVAGTATDAQIELVDTITINGDCDLGLVNLDTAGALSVNVQAANGEVETTTLTKQQLKQLMMGRLMLTKKRRATVLNERTLTNNGQGRGRGSLSQHSQDGSNTMTGAEDGEEEESEEGRETSGQDASDDENSQANRKRLTFDRRLRAARRKTNEQLDAELEAELEEDDEDEEDDDEEENDDDSEEEDGEEMEEEPQQGRNAEATLDAELGDDLIDALEAENQRILLLQRKRKRFLVADRLSEDNQDSREEILVINDSEMETCVDDQQTDQREQEESSRQVQSNGRPPASREDRSLRSANPLLVKRLQRATVTCVRPANESIANDCALFPAHRLANDSMLFQESTNNGFHFKNGQTRRTSNGGGSNNNSSLTNALNELKLREQKTRLRMARVELATNNRRSDLELELVLARLENERRRRQLLERQLENEQTLHRLYRKQLDKL